MAKPDVNFWSYADKEDFTIPPGTRFDPRSLNLDPQSYDDVLKFSHAKRVVAKGIYVAGGRENAVDMNRGCESILIADSTIVGGDQAGMVIKGASRGIVLEDVMFIPSPKSWCDILIGDWSDQSTELSTTIILTRCQRHDGRPLRVVVGRATMPIIAGGNARVHYPLSYALKAYWWAKFAAVRTGIVK